MPGGDELLLLHSPYAGTGAARRRTTGGTNKMARRRCNRWKNVYSAATGGYVRRCAGWSGTGLLGGLEMTPALGQATTLRGTFGDIKDVLMVGGIAAGGAVLTNEVFTRVAESSIGQRLDLTGYKRALAEATTGIILGIVIGKFLKRPRLAANIAIGPVVVASLRLVGELMHRGPFQAAGVYDIGAMAVNPFQQETNVLGSGSRGMGSMQVGPGVPSWMTQPEMGVAGALGGF